MVQIAETVAVDLIAKVDEFDGKVKRAANDFDGNMKRITKSAEGAEKAVENLNKTAGKNGFDRLSKSAREAGISAEDYRNRLRRVAAASKELFDRVPEIKDLLGPAPDPREYKKQRADFVGEILRSEKQFIAQGIPETTADLNELFTTSQKTGLSIGRMTAYAVAAGAAFKVVQFAITEGLPAYLDQQAALDKFGASLESTGNLSLATAAQIEEMAVSVAKSTLQTEESSLKAAASLATIPGLARETMAAALDASARFADAMGTDVAGVITGRVAPAFLALADNDVPALYSALEDLNPTLARTVVELADAGKTAEAQQALIAGLSDAAGDGPHGLKTATDRLSDAWLDLKRQLGEDIAGPVTTMLTAIADSLDWVKMKANETRGALASMREAGGARGWIADAVVASFPSLGEGQSQARGGGLFTDIASRVNRAAESARAIVDRKYLQNRFADAPRGGGGGGRRGPDPAEVARREAEAEARRLQAFYNELASMRDDELSARKALVTSAEEIARLELQIIEISRRRYDDNLNSQVELKKLTDEEAAQLRAINDERAGLRAELVQRREDERRFRMAEDEIRRQAMFGSEQRGLASEILAGQADLVRTQKERRDIERRLISLQFAEEKARNDYLIGYYERLKVQEGITESELAEAAAAAKIAELRNASLAQRQDQAVQISDRSTASPLEAMLSDIPQTADQINEALENAAAGGLATFTDSLTDAIVNFRSLGDVGMAVLQSLTAALVRMAIQQLILKALGPIFGFSEGGQIGSFAGGGMPVPAYSGGGMIRGPGTSTSDSIPAITSRGPIRVSDGEYLIRGESVRKLGVPLLDQMNASGEVPRGFALGGMPSISNAPAGRSSGIAFASIRPEDMRQLAKVVSDAASAMPDVKLYPTADPASALRAALADPAGQRAFFDFFSANSGKAQASLQR